ncbi:MAG: GrpB family protein [Candidatus Sericytochromatia bacterium]|nr:GrpB family protein [Candidatus Tanganyikabacteria bacterium]
MAAMAEQGSLRTDAEIQAYTVGAVVPYGTKVVVVDYDPRWPDLFRREADRVRAALGERVLLLEHVGSTSVPGLPAKPVVDMVLAVPDSSAEKSYVSDLEGSGYVLRIREPNWFQHRVFKGPDTACNLHVFTAGCPEVDRMVAFRDWLRAHPDDLERYAQVKRDLARREWRFVQHYADAKTPVVRAIMARAGYSEPPES